MCARRGAVLRRRSGSKTATEKDGRPRQRTSQAKYEREIKVCGNRQPQRRYRDSGQQKKRHWKREKILLYCYSQCYWSNGYQYNFPKLSLGFDRPWPLTHTHARTTTLACFSLCAAKRERTRHRWCTFSGSIFIFMEHTRNT